MSNYEKLMSQPMRIIRYPDERLRIATEALEQWTTELHLISQGMIALCLANESISISANQVGYPYRFFINCQSTPQVIINPEIIEITDNEYDYLREGCLSFSKILYYIKRPTYIKVKYNDIRFNTIEKSLSGIEAKIFSHELDHLNGKLMIDHFNQEEKDEFIRRYK